MKALILAAGEGTRLRPLTLDRPKPMVPLLGRPLLEYLVALLRHHQITDIAINLHYRPAAIVDYFGDGSRFGVSITYSHEETLLGSAGAARRLDWFLDQPFLVLYGDVLTDLDLTELARRHAAASATVTLAVYAVPDPERCGIVQIHEDGWIQRFVEKPSAALGLGNLASTGVCVMDPSVLACIPPATASDFGGDLFPELLNRRLPFLGVRTDAYVQDIGSLDRYAAAESDLRAGRVNSPLLSQTRMASTNRQR